jgi:hypothetical protein
MASNGTDETTILENRRACARHETEVVARSLWLVEGLRKSEVEARVQEHLDRAEGGAFRGVLQADEITRIVSRAKCSKPRTQTSVAPSGPEVETVGKPQTQTVGGALSLTQFMAVERTPLEWVVGDILPQKGRALLTASAKSGKTFFALELGLSVAAGVDFLGLQIPKSQRVLYCQSELSDALLNRRLGWIRETMPFGFPWELAGENFHVVENDPVRVTLADESGRARIENLIETWKPDLLILDPLYDLFRGLEENDAGAVATALGIVSGFAARGPAVLLVHHHGKNKESRGSSVLQGWSESDLSMTPACDDCLRIDALLRCAFGDSFPMHVRKPFAEGRAWFETMPPGWEPPNKQSKEKISHADKAVEVLSQTDGRGMRWSELCLQIKTTFGCSEATARRAIDDAKESGDVACVGGVYFTK